MNEQKKRVFTRYLIALLIILLVAVYFIKQLHSEAKSVKNVNDSSAVVVSTIVAERNTITRQMKFSGLIVGREEVPVYAELPQSRIAKVLAEEGQQVKTGQPLATIDTSLLNIQKSQQEATLQRASQAIAQQESLLEEAKSQYVQAKSEKLRADAIADSGLLSTEAIEQRATAAKIAESHVKSAQNNLAMAQADFALNKGQSAEAELRLDQASINAPVSGKIISRKTRVGMLLGQVSEPLFVILRDNLTEVEFEASANEVAQLKSNTAVSIQILGDTSTYHGKIRHIASTIDSQSQSAKVRVSFNKSPELALGLTAQVNVMLPPKKAIYLPDTAILIEGTSSFVFTTKDGNALRIPIKTGDRSNGMVEITAGLDVGTVIIDRFTAYLHDGEPIKVIANRSVKNELINK